MLSDGAIKEADFGLDEDLYSTDYCKVKTVQ